MHLHAAAVSVRYQFADFELHPEERRLLAGGRDIPLGAHAFDLLVALVEHGGRLVTKDKLLAQVWPKVVVEENTLQVHISSLRKVLGANAIATVSGRGYRFNLDIADVSAGRPSLPTPGNNLPHPLTSFIGRERVLTELQHLSGRTRLLTLTGSGGCGKTRLAIQLARYQLHARPDGVWLVELATLTDPLLLPQTAADVLGIKQQAGARPIDTIAGFLASRAVLLLLDNAEHLLDACAEFAVALLGRCERLAVLVTSRERLGVMGELTYRVPSLSVPDGEGNETPEAIAACEATRLFVERAKLQVPHFEVTLSNAAAIGSICRQLDGIPLAIELAAPRVRTMPVDELGRRLDQRFGLLTEGSRTALPRQRTLRSVVDWSYDLLDDAEKTMLCRMSVFSGGWTLPAAEQVCAGEGLESGEVFNLLASLVDKSLVTVEPSRAAARYRLLETMHHYARDRLRERGSEETMRRQHLAYFAKEAEAARMRLLGPEQSEWLDRLEAEMDNARAALSWSATSGLDAENGLRLAAALWRFWAYRGYLVEGRRLLAAQLDVPANPPPTGRRAAALHALGVLATAQGDYAAARTAYEEGLEIRRRQGDHQNIGSFLASLGNVALEQGDYSTARGYYDEAAALFRALGDTEAIATCLDNIGITLSHAGDFEAARVHHDESLAIRRQLGDRWGEACTLMNLAENTRETGDLAATLELFAAAEAIYRELGDQRSVARSWRLAALARCDHNDHEGARALLEKSLLEFVKIDDETDLCEALRGLAYANSLRDPRRAAILWGAAMRSRERRGVRAPPRDAAHEAAGIDAARAALGDDGEFDRCWQQGLGMSLEQAVHLAMGSTKA